MSVTIQINSTTLIPQPGETSWEQVAMGEKLDGTNGLGAYWVHTLKAPVFSGGTASFNWDSFDNSVLTSIRTHAPGDTMRGTAVTYSSGVVSKPIMTLTAPPGGLVREVELRISVIL